MPPRLSRTMPTLGRLLAGLCLALVAWLGSLSARAEDILLTGAEDSPGMQAFATALGELRPTDTVHFQPLSQLPAPSQLPRKTRLILLDLPSLDWRLQDPEAPQRWRCASAACKPANDWEPRCPRG